MAQIEVRQRKVGARTCLAVASLLLFLAASVALAQAVPNAPIPDSDPFYAQPDPMPSEPAGTILDSRAVTFRPFGGIPLPNPAWQLKYLSRDTLGLPIAAIATVLKPLVPSPIGPVLLSYQSAEDSLGMRCAPSHTLTGSTANGNTQAESAAYLSGLYGFGWTVVVPDHEGPYSVYGVGTLEGQITLDGIRAAENFAPLGLLGSATPAVMWGYSGGALATAWASSLQQSYAPELNIVAVASGGTPADLKSAAQAFDSGLGNAVAFSLGLSAVIGINRVYTDLMPDSILNDKGRAAVAALKDGCVGMTADGSPAPTGHFADYVTIDDPLNSAAARATYPKIDLPQPGRTPVAEIYVYHSQFDELIPIAGTDAMVRSWCADGAKVHYYRGVAGEHIAFAVTGGPDAALFLESRLAGAPPLVPLTTQSCN
jgi:Secretory lipase